MIRQEIGFDMFTYIKEYGIENEFIFVLNVTDLSLNIDDLIMPPFFL